MFRTVSDQVSLWEAVLPPELVKLPDELARVDALLAVTTLGWPQAIKGLTWIKDVTQALSDE